MADKKEWWRVRFQTKELNDPRPIIFPPPGPYWATGFNDTHATIVAYLNAPDDVRKYWPEAEDMHVEKVEKPTFTERFPKPDWWVENP